jgi:hypothetical protein
VSLRRRLLVALLGAVLVAAHSAPHSSQISAQAWQIAPASSLPRDMYAVARRHRLGAIDVECDAPGHRVDVCSLRQDAAQ